MADINPITPVAAGIQPPQQMSLGDMMNMARGAQAYQQAGQVNPLLLQQQQQSTRIGEIGLSVEEQKNIERKNMQIFASDPANFQTNGRIDIDKINAQVPKLAPLTGSDYIKNFSDLSTAQTAAEKASMGLTQDNRNLIASTLGVAGRAGVTDPQMAISELKMLVDQNPNNKHIKSLVEDAYVPIFSKMQQGPQVTDALIKASQAILTPAQIQERFAQQPGTLNTGEQIFQTVTTPGVGNIAPRIQLGAQPLADVGIPPTQEVIDPVTGQKRLIGPASQRANQPIVTDLGPAQTKLLGAGGLTISDDWTKTVADAKEAPQRVAIFQNIKKFAPDSFTGVGGQRKELATGILNAIGISAYEAEKVSTEELAKNSALLALAGGNTDAARALAEVATPNKKLNEKAILSIADQMIGIDNMKVARQNFLAPVQNDAIKYSQKMQQFNAVADPRLFQEMSRDEVQKLFNSMSPAARAELTNKVRTAKQLGIIK
jgi:hypothetical protein